MEKFSVCRAAVALCLVCAGPLPALAQTAPASVPAAAQSLSFDAAWQQVKGGSERLLAARAAVQSKTLQGEGLQGLDGPTVTVAGASYAYSATVDLNLDPVNQRLAQLGQALPISLAKLLPPPSAIQLPQNYNYTSNTSDTRAWLSAMWPLYVGGATDATRAFVAAQAGEAQADEQRTEHELMTQLVQRYFGSQLAAKAAQLREAAYQNVAEHDRAVEKMLTAGVVSRVERLQARAATEEARRNAQKARDDADLSTIALARTVRAVASVAPDSPLFVSTTPVQPLAYFTEAALLHHPGLAKVAAKKTQAEQLHAGEQALRKPQLFAFAQHQIATEHPDWVAGLGVRWTLFDALDRDKLASASLQQIAQAEHSDAQARSDIALLIERNWRLLEQARRQFISLQPGVDVAQEVLRLRVAGLREGTSTTMDLMDAETSVVKVQTERAQAAYDYVVALANLLEGCGLSEQFATYMARADVKVQ